MLPFPLPGLYNAPINRSNRRQNETRLFPRQNSLKPEYKYTWDHSYGLREVDDDLALLLNIPRNELEGMHINDLLAFLRDGLLIADLSGQFIFNELEIMTDIFTNKEQRKRYTNIFPYRDPVDNQEKYFFTVSNISYDRDSRPIQVAMDVHPCTKETALAGFEAGYIIPYLKVVST